MRKTVLLLLCVSAVLFSNAQAPVNDEYTGALEVIPSTDASCKSSTSGTTIGATESMPGCFGSAEDDIWFKFTATSNRHRIIVSGEIINHVLELFNLSSGNLTSMACRYLTSPSSYGGLTAEFNTLIPGTTYYYRVYGSGSSSQRGQISSCIISPPLPPANDECSDAIELPVNPDDNCTSVYSGKFGYASQSLPAFINKGYDAFDVWFKFTATAASHRIRLTYDDNTTTPLMQAFSGDCNNLDSLAYFTPSTQSEPVVGMLTNLTPGNTYYIRVYNDFSVSRPNETLGLCISSPLGAPGYQFPTISLTSPANGSVFTAPAFINLSATIVEGEEPVQKVEFFYRDGQHSDIKLGEDLTAPYEYTWNDVFPGEYRVTAKATDLIGATAISAIDITVNTPPANQLPTVSLSAYSVGSGIAPGTIVVNFNAADIDGTISKIEIYQNGLLFFEAQPWDNNITFADVSNGVYTYQAKAIDNQGGATFSDIVSVFIQAPLTVTFTSPLNNTTFTAPATITLEATPSGGEGTFEKVEFFNGTTKLGEDLTAPYAFNWTNVPAGTYSLTAKVTHSMGDNATSTAVSITVTNQAPTVSLTAPANGATFTAPATVSLTATASDADGSIAKVEFYNGTTKLGEDFTVPYEYSWNGVSEGMYSLSAKAIDNLGAISSSTNVSVTVTTPPPVELVAKNSVWRYHDKGVDLGTTWTAINYNDAPWSSGAGVLGYGVPVTTTLNYGNKNSKYQSYYFRRSFNIADAGIYATLVFNIRRDDGAVVYLNGVEQLRTNMPGVKINYKTLASSDINGSAETNYVSFRIPASQLRNGINVIAVSVHQSDRKSSDMSFDMEVIGELKTLNILTSAGMNTRDNTNNNEISAKDKGNVLVKALPNPSTSYFTLLPQGNRSETIDIKVIDAMGRVVETMRKLPANGAIKFGYDYRPGIYFTEVVQGTQRTTLKLIKSTE